MHEEQSYICTIFFHHKLFSVDVKQLVTVVEFRCVLASNRRAKLARALAGPFVAGSLMALNQEVKDQIAGIVSAALKDGKVMQAKEQLMQLLRKHHLLRSMRLEPDLIGAHMLNRDGFGLSPTDVHLLIENVIEVGFNINETCGLCVELNEQDQKKCFDFNQALAKGSGGMLPDMEVQMCKYGSLSGSHLNAALRSILHETKHPVQGSQITANGHVSFTLVESMDKAFAAAAKEGVNWTVVSPAVGEIPGVCALLQEAGNTTAQLSKHESEFQVLMRIQGLMKRSQYPIWDDIKKVIHRTKPLCSQATPYMFTFLMKFGRPEMLQSLEKRLKVQSSLAKSIGPEVFQAFCGESKEDKGTSMALMRHAMLGLAYCNDKVKISPGDVKKIYSKDCKDSCSKGQKLMIKLRLMIRALPDPEAVDSLLYRFEDSVVLLALDLKRSAADAITMEGAALRLVDSVEEVTGVRMTTEFDGFRAELDGLKAASSTGRKDHEATMPLAYIDRATVCDFHISSKVFLGG